MPPVSVDNEISAPETSTTIPPRQRQNQSVRLIGPDSSPHRHGRSSDSFLPTGAPPRARWQARPLPWAAGVTASANAVARAGRVSHVVILLVTRWRFFLFGLFSMFPCILRFRIQLTVRSPKELVVRSVRKAIGSARRRELCRGERETREQGQQPISQSIAE
jgi:hypothetical protein